MASETRKILQIVADGSPGGGTTHVLQILSGLSNDYDMGLITEPDSYLSQQAGSWTSSVFGIDSFGVQNFPANVFALRRSISEFRPDILHIHGGRAAYFTSLLKSKIGKVYTVHGYHFLQRFFLRRHTQIYLERMAAKHHKIVIFVSQHDRKAAQKFRLLPPTHTAKVIYNGISLDDKQSQDSSHAKKIGFVGRLEYPKDPHLFLDTMRLLPDRQAVMIGDGSMAEGIRREIAEEHIEHLDFLGGMTHEEVLNYLPSLGVLVMTSRWEGLPIIALEAIWAGVPVIATNVGGLSEIIENGKSGILIDSRDPEVIAQQVRNVLEDDALRQRLIVEGRKRVEQNFSEERMLNQIKAVYESVLASAAK